MQVFGLPGQFIRNGRAALRLDAKAPNIEAARRRDAAARDGERSERRTGRPGGGRAPLDALPMGEVSRTALGPAQTPSPASRLAQRSQ
jgi:hypothetical protein